MTTQTYIVPCPHCGHKRQVSFHKGFWTETDHVFWSDGRIESDDWFEPTHTQQCPKCGKFFTRDPQGRLTMVDKPCTDKAILSYPQLRAAIKEVAGNPYSEEWARIEAWEAFNAFYQDADEIPKEEQEFNRSNMQRLLDFYHSLSPWRFTDTEFELNRLLGNRDACERMLEITCEEYIRQKKDFRIRRGLPWDDDKERWTRRYNNLMAELKAALDLPLKPYKK
ncbi:MAG: phage terminase large subunit family protein [Paludibacteraceae bacterium]|nr:phage terminase large subunit family protein [Paludibacteraceae bacterium]